VVRTAWSSGTSSPSNTPNSNRLLAALPEADYQALLPFLEPVPLPLGMALYESRGAQGYVYFPTSSIVSLLYVLEDGSSAEIAATGGEGLVGIAVFMGGALRLLLLRFTQALITQMTQTAVCNAITRSTSSCAAGCY
jgi:hypothetical protein